MAIIAKPMPRLADGRVPVISSGFDSHLKRRKPSTTPGLDIVYRTPGGGFDVPAGTPAIVPIPGVVERVQDTRRGVVVSINHGRGVRTVYRHLRDPVVRPTQPVVTSFPIGTVSFDPQDAAKIVHLHFELRFGSRFLNPAPLFALAPATESGVVPANTSDVRIAAAIAQIRRTARTRAIGANAWLVILFLLVLSKG